MQTVGIVINTKKEKAFEVCNWLLDYFAGKGIAVVLPEEDASSVGRPDLAVDEAQFRELIDIAISLGGDGTLLGTARRMAGTEKPILGVNLGHLGFLTDLELGVLPEGIERLVQGKYILEKRAMLETTVLRNGQQICHQCALNDVVVVKGAIARVIRLNTYVEDKHVDGFSGDGLIVSTATGSTGYSLSAGGSLIHPSLPVIVITPICPHTIGSRPLVISDSQQLKVVVQANHAEILLTVDGQLAVDLLPDDQIIVQKAPYVTNLLKVSGRDYFEVLHTKMRSSDID